MNTRITTILTAALFMAICCTANGQTVREEYEKFRNKAMSDYASFRGECNKRYAEFLKNAWKSYEKEEPIAIPDDTPPVPPLPFSEEEHDTVVEIIPTPVVPILPEPQPLPVEPIQEVPLADEKWHEFKFYGLNCRVRISDDIHLDLKTPSPASVSNCWKYLSRTGLNNTIRDCLETRIRYNLCDWAYLQFIDNLSRGLLGDSNDATLLMAYLYCQSGYQIRLASNGNRLVMLFGSRHKIYNKTYYTVGNTYFYPYGDVNGRLAICDAVFEGETPMSLIMQKEQKLGERLSDSRTINANGHNGLTVKSQVPCALIDFYNSYPTSSIGSNSLTRWAMYANTPLSNKVKDLIYPTIRNAIENNNIEEAANKLLNWVQTGFAYEFDDKVWGCDRAFFAEETLYYPYCDCEDRAILFSHLIRDLLNLDVALVYYPGHLTAAVDFQTDVHGDAITVEGRKFIICDPTYIGAPVGAQMPGLQYNKSQAIILDR